MTRFRVAIVAIGRNEGVRLQRCMRSVSQRGFPVVYVDSGSTDDSREIARSAGAEVVVLSPDRPFTAARARNAGFEYALERHPEIAFVQFLDGDCELEDGWLEIARDYLESHPDVAAVCGRRRETDPRRNLYHRLIDMEWEGAPGEVQACGGDVFVRAPTFRAVHGYDESLVAGEDPDLCYRLRERRHRIVRLAHPMTRHDAGIDRAGQWLRRSVRAGHSYAERWWLRGDPSAGRRAASSLVWGGLLPGVAVAGAAAWSPLLYLLLFAYAGLALRIVHRRRLLTPVIDDRVLYAAACIVGKFAELWGMAIFGWRLLARTPRTLIEYKGPRDQASASSRDDG